MTSQITTKLFVGFLITLPIRIQLNESEKWQQGRICSESHGDHLVEIRYNRKDYLGLYGAQEKITKKDLIDLEFKIKHTVGRYCPDLDASLFKIFIFPQMFIH